MYTALYSFNQVVSRKGDLSATIATLQSILQSSFFLGFNAYSVILVFCLSRRYLGKFYYILAAHLPAIIGSYMSIQLERRSRRPALSFYVANIASETVWNKLVNKGWVRAIPSGEVILFAVSTASLLYLMHRNGFGKDPLSFGFRFLLGKEFIEDPIKMWKPSLTSQYSSRHSLESAFDESGNRRRNTGICKGLNCPSTVVSGQSNRGETRSVNDVINIETSGEIVKKGTMKRRGRERTVSFTTTINEQLTTSESESLEEGSQDEEVSSVDSGCQSQEEEGKRMKSSSKKTNSGHETILDKLRKFEEDEMEEEGGGEIILRPLTANHCLINGQGIINFSCPHSILGMKEKEKKKMVEEEKQTKNRQEDVRHSVNSPFFPGMESAVSTSDAPLTSTSSSRVSASAPSSSLYFASSSTGFEIHSPTVSFPPLLSSSCLTDSLAVSLRNFLLAYTGHSVVSLFMRPKGFLSHPIKSLNQAFVEDKKSLQLGLFLGSFTLLFKTSNCILRNLLPPPQQQRQSCSGGTYSLFSQSPLDHYPKLTFLSALIASSSMLLYPSSTTAQYMLWKLIETVYFLGVKSGKVKAVDFTLNMIYAVSTAQLFYVAVMEPKMMRKSYTKWLNRVTRGSFALLNRNIIDIFGTQASSGYEFFEPNLQLDHTSNKFQESVLVWMI